MTDNNPLSHSLEYPNQFADIVQKEAQSRGILVNNFNQKSERVEDPYRDID